MNLKILLLRFKLKTYFATCRGILRGLAPLGEGVAEDTTKRQRLVAGARGLRNEHVGAKFPAILSPPCKKSFNAVFRTGNFPETFWRGRFWGFQKTLEVCFLPRFRRLLQKTRFCRLWHGQNSSGGLL